MNMLWLLPLVLRATVQLTVCVLLLHVVLRFVQPHSARFHRRAWLAVICAGLVVLPFTWKLPCDPAVSKNVSRLSGGLLSAATLSPADRRAAAKFNPTNGEQQSQPASATTNDIRFTRSDSHSAEGLQDDRLKVAASEKPVVVRSHPAATESRQAVAASTHSGSPSQFVSLFTTIWLAGIAGLALTMVGGYGILLSWVRRCPPADESAQRELTSLVRHMGLDKQVVLRLDDRRGPFLVRQLSGYSIVVPRCLWSQLPRRERLAVLRHELAHLQRGDVWKSLLARVAVLPHWFNPCAWWALLRFEETAEWECDAAACRQAPRQAPALATALLKIVETAPPAVGLSAARGPSLVTRVQRLLSQEAQTDSMFKQAVSTAIVTVLFCGVMTRFQLVAQETTPQEETATVDASLVDDFDRRLATFADQLIDDSEQLHRFKQILNSPIGPIVVAQRADDVVYTLRKTAVTDSVDNFAKDHFEQRDGKLTLRSDHLPLRESIINHSRRFEEDVAQIEATLKTVAKRIATKGDQEQLLKTFLNRPGAAATFYLEEVYPRMHPTMDALLEKSDGRLVRAADGRIVIRPARRQQVESQLRIDALAVRHQSLISLELVDFAKELVGTDTLHQHVKSMFADPQCAALMATWTADEHADDMAAGIHEFFDYLNDMTVDTVDGVVIHDDHRAEMTQIASDCQRFVGSIKLVKAMREELLESMPKIDKLHVALRKMLSTDVGLVRMTEVLEYVGSEVESTGGEVLDWWLVENDEGELVVSEEATTYFPNMLNDWFDMTRRLRRQRRLLKPHFEDVADDQLRKSLQSPGGVHFVTSTIERRIADKPVDGLKLWVSTYFNLTDDGYELQPETGPDELIELLTRAKEVREELANSDF